MFLLNSRNNFLIYEKELFYVGWFIYIFVVDNYLYWIGVGVKIIKFFVNLRVRNYL